MRNVCNVLAAQLINEEGEVRSFCIDIDDLPILWEKARKESLKVQFVEIANCSDFTPADTIRLTMKYPNCSFCEWCALDSADYSQIIGNSEMFADYVRERGFHNFDFYCQRILSVGEQEKYLNNGVFQPLITDEGLDEIVLPERDIEAEKKVFINAIEEKNAKVKTLDINDIQIENYVDTEKKEWGRYWVKYRTVHFSYRGNKYSAVFNTNTKTLKPDYSSKVLAITSYEENEDFDPKGYQTIVEAFWIEEQIPLTDKLKKKLAEL